MSKFRLGNTGIVRVALIFLFMLAQIAVLLSMLVWFGSYFVYLYGFCLLITVVVTLHIINKDINPAYQIAWLLPVLLLPVFGGLFYLLFGKTWLSPRERRRLTELDHKYRHCLEQLAAAPNGSAALEQAAAAQSHYLAQVAGTPLFGQTNGQFLPSGELMYQKMLEALAQAEKFIFLEFFIIEEGQMWSSMLKILEEKAQNGVDVRVIYDDYGSLLSLPSNYNRILEQKGIKCRVYNRFKASLSSRFNTRDHRKICVVDGDRGFVGGINLADEYINVKKVYGHWHDCGLLLEGKAVASLSAMFLTMWSFVYAGDEDYRPFLQPAADWSAAGDGGLYQPYNDSPLDLERVGQSVYLNLLNRARQYVYISSPFLVIDNEMIGALCHCAKSGVDVRIITPRVGAKLMSAISHSYYSRLLAAGVRIYEYIPGYIHSKTYVCDDHYAVVGSINMDYRSLYLSHENAVWMVDAPAVDQIHEDYLQLLAQSREITLGDCRRVKGITRLMQAILRLFAPLA